MMARGPMPPAKPVKAPIPVATRDSFVNFAAKLGIGAQNVQSAAAYTYNPITRNRVLCENMYRGSWLVKQTVDAVADDMTRAGVEIGSTMPPDQIDLMQTALRDLMIWPAFGSGAKWSRLYGGAIGVLLIDGQDMSTPLRIETVGLGQFRGITILDRWMVQSQVTDLITDYGPQVGTPRFYIANGGGIGMVQNGISGLLHHTRCIRFDGIDLPPWQRASENGWGMSIIEPMYDRLVAFDSTTNGAAQLVHKAHLRVLKLEGYRDAIAMGGAAMDGVAGQMDMIRMFQTIEGLTVLDDKDEFQTYGYSFGGLSDILLQFAQQLSGATGIPAVRLFGQSPAGLSATGESDMRNYYDMILQQQESRFRPAMQVVLGLLCYSVLGVAPPPGFHFSFTPLWQMSHTERADIAAKVTTAVQLARDSGIVSDRVALMELRANSRVTGVWTNISDADIAAAADDPPEPGEAPSQGGPGADDENDADEAGEDMPSGTAKAESEDD